MKKLRDQKFYEVVNKDGKILAKKTTDKNGKKMIKLLNYIDAKNYKKKYFFFFTNYIIITTVQYHFSEIIIYVSSIN